MRISYSRNPLLLLACFTEQSSHYRFDIMAVPVADTFAYSVTIAVKGRTTAIVSISEVVLHVVTSCP